MTVPLAAFLLAAAIPGAAPTHPAPVCLTCTQPHAQPARSRYRIDPVAGEVPGDNARSVIDDGSRCSVIGARLCTRKPRTIFRTDFTG